MARLYEIRNGDKAWNPNKCEETLLLIAFEQVFKFIPANETWRHDFERVIFNEGKGYPQEYIDHINSHRRRRKLPLVKFIETDIDAYGRNPDSSFRIEERRLMREAIRAMNDEQRQGIFEAAIAEAALLPPPHKRWEQFKAERDRREEESREAETRRLLAHQQARQNAAKAETRRHKLLRMLRLGDAVLQADIIAKLTGDEALDLAEQVDGNGELRNALVRRALDADGV